jgi:hypothetical protein
MELLNLTAMSKTITKALILFVLINITNLLPAEATRVKRLHHEADAVACTLKGGEWYFKSWWSFLSQGQCYR